MRADHVAQPTRPRGPPSGERFARRVAPRRSRQACFWAPAALLPGVLRRSPTSKLDGRLPASALPGGSSLTPSAVLEPTEWGAAPWYREFTGVYQTAAERASLASAVGSSVGGVTSLRHRAVCLPDEHQLRLALGTQSGPSKGKHRPGPLLRCSGRGSPPCKFAAGAQPVLPRRRFGHTKRCRGAVGRG